MLVSHETPIAYLDESRKYNDYDYALCHLFETHPEYYNFFKVSLAQGREVLLDNSIFELKTAFDPDKFAEYVRELKPTYYIAPDVLEDSQATIDSFKAFREKYPDLPGLCIGAVQGNTFQEIVDCYKFMSENADYIAISFDFSWYQQIGLSNSKDPALAKLEKMSSGRRMMISMLQENNIWNYNKPHHLLGNSLPQEMKEYCFTPSIRSVDTSNPVVAGIHNIRYITKYGMTCKPSVMLADLIDIELNEDQKEDLQFNVKEYRKLTKFNQL